MTLDELPGVTVTVLVDNVCGKDGVLGEWGLSFLVDAGDRRIMLDTGAGHVLLGNARAMKLDLATVDTLVLSHGHFDHTDGIESLLGVTGPLRVFAHPEVFTTKFWNRDSAVRPMKTKLSREQLAARVRDIVDTTKPTVVAPGVMVTGEIPRETDFEDTGLTKDVFRDEAMTTPDPIPDDQAVVFRVPQGVVVLFGCGHSGVVNTLRRVRTLLGVDRVHAVMGGTHLMAASPTRMAYTIAELKTFGVERILLSHCTGFEAYAALAHAFPGQCSWPTSGTAVTFGTR